MKKIAILILSVITLYSCSRPEKPKKLMSEKQMEDVLYDMSVLQAISSFTPKTLDDNNVNGRTYIYHKYKIDSLTLVQNQMYYAQDLEGYKKMQQRIADRLKAERKALTAKKPGDKKAQEITPAATLPSPGSGTIPLAEEQKAMAQHKRDSVRAVSQKRLKRVPATEAPKH